MRTKPVILVIDDDLITRTLLGRLIEKEGAFMPMLAADGKQGIEMARKIHPALVFLDWVMPGASGMEVLAALRKEPWASQIPIVMLTSKNMMGEIDHALSKGADGYVVKPTTAARLQAEIHKRLNLQNKAPEALAN